MNKIVDRDTFLYYLDNADVNWEATARECIAKGFELAEENKKLKEKLEKILNFCKILEDVKEEYMRIQLIKEIIEDKKDIHSYLEQDEVLKDEYN